MTPAESKKENRVWDANTATLIVRMDIERPGVGVVLSRWQWPPGHESMWVSSADDATPTRQRQQVHARSQMWLFFYIPLLHPTLPLFAASDPPGNTLCFGRMFKKWKTFMENVGCYRRHTSAADRCDGSCSSPTTDVYSQTPAALHRRGLMSPRLPKQEIDFWAAASSLRLACLDVPVSFVWVGVGLDSERKIR